ncbi:MAG: hypothetical protein PHP52_04215 [Bacteroidales bacterium]|nr:hypothetical protein [Bacteroidales bacterium]MDD4217365.1 hypothetical protein [Bacteroidales bacterium]MDY0141266.1 hypothetical protein [Bacteroidales bacterium]
MKKTIVATILFTILGINYMFSQSVGFSYFFPKNGYFSNPIAPINISLPIKFGKYLQISPGIGLSNIGGMSMSGFPTQYKSNIPLVGSFQSFEINVLPGFVLPFKNIKFEISGGGFAFTSFNTKIIYGNFNNMIAQANNYDFVNTNVSIDKDFFGYGFIFGSKISFRVRNSVWGYIGANYYMGSQKMALEGNYTAVKNNLITSHDFSFPETKILYHGLQISVGAIF